MKSPNNDLQRLLQRQNFKNEKEVKDFMASLVGQKVPEISWDQLTPEEKAQNLVDQAYEEQYLEDVQDKLKKALSYDPDCISAYLLQARISENAGERLRTFKKAVEVGEKKFGGDFEQENTGHFWGLYETRPYMEALFSYAEELHEQRDVHGAVAVAEKMLALNPNDNQGVRDPLSTWLVEAGDVIMFEELMDRYLNDMSVSHHYNQALISLREYGNDEETRALMDMAVAFNPYVVGLLLSKPRNLEIPEYYNPREESGAILYYSQARKIWATTFGAHQFLKSFEVKAKEHIRDTNAANHE